MRNLIGISRVWSGILLDLLDQDLTYPQIAARLNRKGYKTVRGHDYTNKTVHRIIKRLSLGKQTYDQWCREHLPLIQSSVRPRECILTRSLESSMRERLLLDSGGKFTMFT